MVQGLMGAVQQAQRQVGSGAPAPSLLDAMLQVVPEVADQEEGDDPLTLASHVLMQTLSLPEMFQLIGGDWTPIQRLQAPLAALLRDDLLGGNVDMEHIQQLVEQLVEPARRPFELSNLPPGVRERVKEDRDTGELTALLLRKHFVTLCTAILSRDSVASEGRPKPFAEAMQRWCRRFCGEWVERLADALQGGVADVPAFVSATSTGFLRAMPALPGGDMMQGMGASMISRFVMTKYNEYTAEEAARAREAALAGAALEPWESELEESERTTWRATLARDQARQEAMQTEPLSDAYMEGQPAAKRRKMQGGAAPAASPPAAREPSDDGSEEYASPVGTLDGAGGSAKRKASD